MIQHSGTTINNLAAEVKKHVSSVPDKEFERPQTIDQLQDLAYLGTRIVYCAMCYLGFDDEHDPEYQILRKAQLELCATHEFICDGKHVGKPEWQKAGAA